MSKDFAECVKKARSGDADAFAELYSLVYKELYRIALLNLNNQHDASDVVSDTVLEAYQTIHKLRDENAFKSWIIKILTVKIKLKRKEYAHIRANRIDPEESGDELYGSEEMDYDSMELMDGFRKLNEDDRLVLSLDVVAGYKSEEIAGMIGSNANTVRSRAARAKEKLKQYLTEK